ncbi:chromosomal replication initiation ATPase DnaA [Neorhizobium galegae]|uniref:ribbon-helix-helix protein, CopG family n=1 Tax=Neorhizobium galegae TaxID=399 RepID=UPI001AE10AC9|nr:ribbon-helix-helix protein, CopG family [Neorhizobium galegae]MBP2547879.1 chromosomal replication initiation ATPase DnaA [Neorhizobium galegae]
MNQQITLDMPDETYALLSKEAEKCRLTVEEFILDLIRSDIGREVHEAESADDRQERPVA